MKFLLATAGPIPRLAHLALLFALAAPPALAVHDPVPAVRIPLNPIGFQTILPAFLAAGSAMATLHYADANHILVTFGLRRLMKRDADDPPEDADRTIGAFLIEIPSGKVVAQAEWRLHDRGQYLWDLGEGRFLLRVREALFLVDPADSTHHGQPSLRPIPLLRPERRIVNITVSADHDLLTLQTTDRSPVVILADAPAATAARSPVLINFYRLLPSAGRLTVAAAGSVRAAAPLALPVHTGGFLDIIEGATRSRFNFRFNTGAGSPTDLGDWDTTCSPHTIFVSRSEFVAFGCRGGSDQKTFGGFNLSGDFMWQQGFYEPHVNPTFAFAPAAGRFALGRTLVTPGSETVGELTPGQITGQEVRVYQTYNGKILFRTTCTPAMRAGQNFALSPDGMHLAILRESAVQHNAANGQDAYTSQEAAAEIYDLPALTRQDEAAVAHARTSAPPDTGLRIDAALKNATSRSASQSTPAATALASAPDPADAAQPSALSSPAPPAANPPALSSDGGGVLPAPAATQQPAGDAAAQQATPRKPPTLYAPDEKHPAPKEHQTSR